MSSWKPQARTRAVIEAARDVIEADARLGFRSTLRRVFYGLVGAGKLPNTRQDYKRLSWTLDKARWAGLLPVLALDDPERPIHASPIWSSASEIVRSAADSYRSDWWAAGDLHVELWAEKRTLSGFLAPIADEYGVPFLACRGFLSLTALGEALERFEDSGRFPTVLYIGDHDPSGLDMDRDITARLAQLGLAVDLHRLALTPQQIDDHQLPPQPTKSTDSRAMGYHADGSWEVDALPPAVLVGLVREAILPLLPDGFRDRQVADQGVRKELRTVMLDLEARGL